MNNQQLTLLFLTSVDNFFSLKINKIAKTIIKTLNTMKNKYFLILSTGKNTVFDIFSQNEKSNAKTPLQTTDNKSDNKDAVSIRLSRKAVKTLMLVERCQTKMYRYGLAERLLRLYFLNNRFAFRYRYGLAERLLRPYCLHPLESFQQVSIRLSRKAVKTRENELLFLLFWYRYGLAERLLRHPSIESESSISEVSIRLSRKAVKTPSRTRNNATSYRYGLAERLLRQSLGFLQLSEGQGIDTA